MLAAESTGAVPGNCVAVEDSTSGVGSAANAKMGLIVGYVGGSHIAPESEEAHAGTLMAGGRSDDGRGADVAVSDMERSHPIIEWFRGLDAKPAPVTFPKSLIESLESKIYVDQSRVA